MTVRRAFEYTIGAIGLLLAALPVAGCSTRVQSTGTYLPAAQGAVAFLPGPQRILVADFSADPSSVGLEQAIANRVQRQLGGAEPAAEQDRAAGEVQQAITDTLIENLRKMGLQAERETPGAVPGGNDLVIQGQIVRIDEGNRTRRLAIGFGAGKSDVRAEAQVYYLRPNAPPQLLQTYDADANSGRKPGLAMGGVGAASGGSEIPLVATGLVGVHGESTQTGVAAEGKHLANRLAYNLAEFFVQQGWIPPSAVPARSLR